MTNVWKLTERQQTIDLLLQACANLYGHITPKQFLLIYNKYNSDKLLKADLLQYSNKLNRQAKNYHIYSNAIVNTTVKSEVIDRVIYYQGNKKFYVPDKEILPYHTAKREIKRGIDDKIQSISACYRVAYVRTVPLSFN